MPRGNGRPNPVDIHVGGRISGLRILNGFSQSMLGDLLGVTFQQVQKYEKGANRVSASRIYDLCHIFGKEPNYFFDEMSHEVSENSPANMRPHENNSETVIKPKRVDRGFLEMAKIYHRIPKQKQTAARNFLREFGN